MTTTAPQIAPRATLARDWAQRDIRVAAHTTSDKIRSNNK